MYVSMWVCEWVNFQFIELLTQLKTATVQNLTRIYCYIVTKFYCAILVYCVHCCIVIVCLSLYHYLAFSAILLSCVYCSIVIMCVFLYCYLVCIAILLSCVYCYIVILCVLLYCYLVFIAILLSCVYCCIVMILFSTIDELTGYCFLVSSSFVFSSSTDEQHWACNYWTCTSHDNWAEI